MYAGPYGNGGGVTRNERKKERKVSLVFRHADSGTKHCSGVESVLLVPGHKILFTASRDGTIKRWNVAAPLPWFEASFEGHTDWVNDIVLVNDVLVSCSNDKTVRIWRGTTPGTLISTLSHHSDYVTSLAAAPQRNVVATAGLRGEVFLIDLATAANLRVYPKEKAAQAEAQPGQPRRVSPLDDIAGDDAGSSNIPYKSSMYGLAMNMSGTLLAAGGADHIVRLWDPRTGDKVAKLRGHTDTVRSLAISADGMHALSGGSDGTIKLWDVGSRRCVHTYKLHSDSVWALLPTEDFSAVYSGGRDKCVFRTNLVGRTAELMLMEQRPVLSLALDSDEGALWVSTDASSVNKWVIPGPEQATAAFPVLERVSLRVRRLSTEVKHPRLPSVVKPSATIEGAPAIVLAKVLNDKRHVLTKDVEGNVGLWDVLSGSAVESYGQVDYAAKEKELFEPMSVPTWFSTCVKMGQLCITLGPPDCFLTEVYAMELGYPDVAEDVKVNYGKLVLDGAFAKWRKQILQLEQQRGLHGRQQQQQPGSPAAAAAAAQLPAADQGPVHEDLWPKYWVQGAVPPAVICQTASGQPWRMLASQFTGLEGEPEELPTWLVDAVLRGANVTPKESKLAFILLPAEGSDMPSLMQSKLNAPRILQVHKVANYCLGKLADLNIHLEMAPQYLKRPAHEPPSPPQASSKPALELLCNGMGVPYEMSLASIKRYIWRKGDDLVFHFRIRNPLNPAPLPVLTPQ